MTDDGGRLGDNILLFCRTLRHAGLPVGTSQVLDALRAAVAVGIREREDFRAALRSTLLQDPAQFRLFDQAFHIWFRDPRLLDRVLALMLPQAADGDAAAASMRRLAQAMATGEAREHETPSAGFRPQADSYSASERLRDKDFAEMSLEEQTQAARLLGRGLRPLATSASRRFRPHAFGSRIDLRRSIRQMMRRDGQLLTLARRRRRLRPPVLVLIADVSGSMSRYSRMFLHFAHTLSAGSGRVHTLVFGTRLSNVTRRLRSRDVDEALRAVAADVKDFDGGTRIASCLRRFNKDWARRLLAQNATVVLLSDGLERDTESDLEFQIQRLRRSCRRLIWLNPMLRYDGFEPLAYGIRTMLPHVDSFLPAHNVDSLGDLGRLVFLDRAPPHGGRAP